jgi:hypothetical protein
MLHMRLLLPAAVPAALLQEALLTLALRGDRTTGCATLPAGQTH